MAKAISDGFISLLIYFMGAVILDGALINGSYSTRQEYLFVFIFIASGLVFLLKKKKKRGELTILETTI